MGRLRGSRSLRDDEVEIIELYWQTHTDEQIAEKLGRSHKTVRAHRIRNNMIKPRVKHPKKIAKERIDDNLHADHVRFFQSLLSRRFVEYGS